MPNVVELTKALIAAESVTPAKGEVFDVLAQALSVIGFEIDRFTVGEEPDGPVENMIAIRHGKGPHFAFAGHLDVVPPGDGWASAAFAPEVRGELLYGRGAVDMKGAIAAFAAAAARVEGPTLSLLITGDEEGPAIYGTRAILDRMAARGLRPDYCLVNHWFQPSNIEVTDITVGNPATNVIPAKASARMSIRFNDQQNGEDLVALIERTVKGHAPDAQVIARISGEAFLTQPGELSALVTRAVEKVAGVVPALSTTGGTSDARFLSQLCPTVEFGLVNATMHKTDEAVAVADLNDLVDIYAEIIAAVA
ncbi:MAG: M20/M25/M40 family metallo-hydrolase [Sphingomonadales bacterium]|nr:M20/M25/M40 family metallo-hydrolase [Sphingomonadales bacterium]